MVMLNKIKKMFSPVNQKITSISWKDITFTSIPIVLLIVLASWATLHLLSPAPPNKIVILGGPKGSSFDLNANRYAEIIRAHGLRVEVVETEGSENNLDILQNSKSKADVGFVQNSSSHGENTNHLISLGTVWVQPLLVFYRGDDINFITQLKGKRVAIGPDDSATNEFVDEVLRENGMDKHDIKALLLEPEDSIKALIHKRVDAIFLTGELVSVERVYQIMDIPGIKVMNFEQAEGYTREFKFLSQLDIPEGAFNLGKNIPHKNIKLIGTSVELIAKDTLHPALSDLIVAASKEVNGKPNMFRDRKEFPKLVEHTIPISEEAQRYYTSGSPFLYKKLPFWLASFLDRIFIIILPLALVLVPASRVIGPIYKWRIRSKIYKWYGALMKIELELGKTLDEASKSNLINEILDIQSKVNTLVLPLAYANELYALREHVEYVKARCLEK
jgi:TRAP-type uncharacterized transport system substrate-binding protein